jgi:membrane protease YdiL (CAAX protease family)
VVVAIIIAGTFGAAGLIVLSDVPMDEYGDREFERMLLVSMSVAELALIGGVWIAAGRMGGNPREVLQIDRPMPHIGEICLALVGLVVAISALNGAIYLYDADWLMANYRSDVEFYLSTFRNASSAPTAIALLAGTFVSAPIAEELLFRGFLMSALAKAKWGFWPVAVLITALWTALHGYSVTGALGVALYGLYFSWLLWRTGQLWLPLICHAFANVLAMGTIAYLVWS